MATGLYDDQDQKTDKKTDNGQSFYDREFDNITKHYNEETTPRRDLRKREESGGTAGGSGGSTKTAPKDGADLNKAEANGGNWKTDLGVKAKSGAKDAAKSWASPPERKKGGKLKKGLLLGGAGGTAIVIVGFIAVLFMFLANFKNVHFAEILRSVGLARFSYTMRANSARAIVDAAVLNDSSTGSLTKLAAGVNSSVPKQLVELGEKGNLKWIVDRGTVVQQITGKQQFRGFEINGEKFSLDDMAQKAFGKDFGKLSRKQTKQVLKTFSDAIQDPMVQVLNLGGRWFRYKIYGSLRDLAGIKLYKWINLGQEFRGKSPEAAKKLNVDETVASVDDAGAPPKTGVKQVDDEAQNAKTEALQAAETGSPTAGQVRTKWANALRTTTKVSTAVFLTTAACIIHSLANSFAQATPQTEKQSLRLGQDPLASAAQTEEGGAPAEAVGADSGRYTDAEKSVIYKQATGETTLTADDQQQLSDIPNIEGPVGTFKTVITDVDSYITSAVVGGPLVQDVLSAIGLGGVAKTLTNAGCNALLNQYVQYSLAGTEILVSVFSAGSTEGVIAGIKAAISGGLTAIGSIGLGELLGTLLDKAVGSAAGLDFSATHTGPSLFNQEYVGVQEFQSYGNRTIAYGAPVSKQTAAAQQKLAMAAIHQQNSELPFTRRYFAMSNPYSLTGKLIAYAPSNLSDLADMVRSGLGSVAAVFSTPQRMFSTIGNLVMPGRYASAEELTNVNTVDPGGVQSWETTQAEQNMQGNGTVDSNGIGFDFASNKDYYDSHKDELDKDYGPCYQQGLQDSIPDGSNGTVNCLDPAYLTSDAARHYRFYMAEMIGIDMHTGDLQ